MADIIEIKRVRKKDKPEEMSLEELLKQAVLIKKEVGLFQETISIADYNGLKRAFESKISKEIIERDLISSDILLCGMYVSDLLCRLTRKEPGSWWTIDYIAPEDPQTLLKGGDMCFVICSIFPERGNIRMMNISYYEKAGTSFYYHFYGITNKEIGYYMSNRFSTMARVVQNCLRNF